jgi:hypothetical protein
MDSLRARRWWARAALGLMVLAAGVLLGFASRRGVWLVLLTAAAVVVVVAAGFWFLLQRGVLRWLALALAVGAPLAVLVVFVVAQLLWVAVTAAGLIGAAVVAARIALRSRPRPGPPGPGQLPRRTTRRVEARIDLGEIIGMGCDLDQTPQLHLLDHAGCPDRVENGPRVVLTSPRPHFYEVRGSLTPPTG